MICKNCGEKSQTTEQELILELDLVVCTIAKLFTESNPLHIKECIIKFFSSELCDENIVKSNLILKM